MTITNLIQANRIRTLAFPLKMRQSLSRTAAGSLRGVDRGVPIWTASYSTATIGLDDCVEFESRLRELDGVIDTFIGFDTRRHLPRLYPSAAFSDTSTINSLGVNGKSLSLAGLPPNFTLSIGDYLSVSVSGVPLLYSAISAVTANASGVTAEFKIAPHYDPGITIGAVVTLKNPGCLMRLEPDSVQFNDAGRALGSITFAASQA